MYGGRDHGDILFRAYVFRMDIDRDSTNPKACFMIKYIPGAILLYTGFWTSMP